MDLLAFIRTADPTKVRVSERQRAEDKPRVLESTVGRIVPLLPIAPARAFSELEASVDRLFDEGASGDGQDIDVHPVLKRQRTEDKPRVLESTVGRVVPLLPIAPARAFSELEASVDRLFDEGASGDGQDIDVHPVVVTTNTIVEDVASLQPRRQRKRKTIVADAGGPSHPFKKLREDFRALGRVSTAGKSMAAVHSLFFGAMLEAEAKGEPVPTLPFVTYSVSATPEGEDKSPADSVPVPNLRTIGAPQRFVIFSDSSHHSGANIAEAECDSIIKSSAPSIATVMTVIAAIDTGATATRAHVAPSLFGVGSSSIGSRIFREMLDEFAPSLPLENRKLRVVVDEQAELQKTKDGEIESLKVQLLLKEAEAAEAIRLRDEVYKFKSVEQSLRGEVGFLRDQNTALEREKNVLNVKVTDLSASIKVREQEVADLDAQVTAVKLQNDNLVGQVHVLGISSAGLQEKVAAYEGFVSQLEKFQDEKLEEVNEKFDKLCADFVEMSLHPEEKFYPHLLTTISGRRWLLTYGMKLAVAKCLNSTEYLSTLGAAISKAVEKGMQEGLSARITYGGEGRQLADIAAYNPSAEADYLSALQHLQSVNKMRENIANHVSGLRGVFVPLSEPLSAAALEGMEGTSGSTPDVAATLSTTLVSASTIPPISTDDYEVAHAESQCVARVDDETVADDEMNLFVSNADLNISE
nr:hypothetical protein [Tanacetum cinerariifolium]